jgi:thiamine pyrophosphate-dependent acetolactate synthase large subunit-like protein
LALMLDRRDVVKRLLIDRKDLLVVPGLGAPTYDVAAAGDHPLNFYLWGAMGGAAMIGLGLALARPDRRVAVNTGDGEMLMGLGSFATIGVKQPPNLSIVVLDNRHYGETGMQASHTDAGIDLIGIARACRFADTRAAVTDREVDDTRRLLHAGKGPSFTQVQVKTDDVPRVLPIRDGHEIKRRFMEALTGPQAPL